MRLWNPLNAPAFLASLTWQQHLRIAVPFCVWELFMVYLATGNYIKIGIAHDPNPPPSASEWLLWALGVEAAEL